MQVSINTAIFLDKVESGKSQYSCLENLTGAPIDNIEVRGEMFKEDSKDSELQDIKQLCMKNGWDFYYSIPEQLFNKDSINTNLESYLKMAKKYGISNLKISLGDASSISGNQLSELNNLLNEYSKVKVTIENQPNENGTLKNMAHQISMMMDKKIRLGYTFDSGNWYWIYEDPMESFNQLKDYIGVFHLKDIKDQTTVLLGEGATDWKKLINKLNPEVPVFLEYAISDDDLSGQIEAVNDVLRKRDK